MLRNCLIVFISFQFIVAQGSCQTALRKHLNIDTDWRFHLGNANDPAGDFNYGLANIYAKSGSARGTAIDSKFNDSTWRIVNLPHDWGVELPFVNVDNGDVKSHGYKPVGGLFPETSVGWYRKHFMLARADSGARFQIQFDGIFRDARVWINGVYLGNNLSGYIGASYDVTDFVHFGHDNVLVVRVDASQYEGWFYEGAGIYRHVWLNEYDNLHVAQGGLFAYSVIKDKTATVTIETTVENQTQRDATCSVYAIVSDRNGHILTQTKPTLLNLGLNGRETLKQKVTLAAPRLWSLEDPYLYKVAAVVRVGDHVVDRVRDRFGIRSLRFDPNDGFFLNGKHVEVKGVCNHQDFEGVGSAFPDALQYYRVRLLQDMGANAYRTSHNPPTPELLDACDSLGMLVLDENRLLDSGPEYLDQFERQILRDRNHPSVFLWSIGNEESRLQATSEGKRIALTLLTKQLELDPSRTSTYAADLPNVFTGVNSVIPIRGFNYRQSAIESYHRDHPTQPVLGTEMGSTVSTRGIYEVDSARGYLPDQDVSAPWWASRAEEWWPLAANHPYWIGGFVWTGFDYRGEPTPFGWPVINSHFGVMDMCGFPKNIYYYYQSWWTNKDVLHISPHWNWKGKEGKPIDVWVDSNADSVELLLNGRSLGTKVMPRNSHLQWSVPYQPGTLEAVGYKNSKRLTARRETTGTPAEVSISPARTTILADGKDVCVLNIEALDSQGREVPDADNLITFSWKGDAKIIGVGNGDPSSHEPDEFDADSLWQRHLFNGKCQVLLQAGTSEDIIRFEAKSKGLRTGSTGIHTIHVALPEKVSVAKPIPPKTIDKIIGADISFLPQLESRGKVFSDSGIEKDPIPILKDHGFNCVRLRIFNNPSRKGGYAPGEGYCDLAHTLQMAARVKAAGMKLLLDFHYSDTWADPEKQFKPAAWEGLGFDVLKDSVRAYTARVIRALKAQGTSPYIVQIGNEINHGMIWPEGHIAHLDSLAELIRAGIAGVKSVDPSIAIMLHIALGGQYAEAAFFLDNMLARNVPFDVIGLSYYPRWHGTLEDLGNNLDRLAKRYDQDIVVVEYSQEKQEVNEKVFNLAGDKGKGSVIWEPLSTWEGIFDRDGKSNNLISIYDRLNKQYLAKD